MKIQRLSSADLPLFKDLIFLLNEVFEEHQTIATDDHLSKLLSQPEFYAVIVHTNDNIIGGCTAYELPKYYNNSSELYIYDIAVKTEFQNKGVGKKLIEFLKKESAENNIETMFVEALSDEEQAVKFYQSSFGKSEKVDHFNLEIK